MGTSDKPLKDLTSELELIRKNGVQANRQHLKQNMHTQFADPFEFAREYVVNSFDAMATSCYISGRETDDTITVIIRDNGKGMDQQRIQDYFKIFRSRKDGLKDQAIGKFGVGKMSVAAVPGLVLFAGVTSTGKECWRFETDTLIEDRPVTLERIEPVPECGTRFEITFKKTSTLSELLNRIYNILYKYVRHLDIRIYFDMPEVDKHHNPIRRKLIKGNWHFDPDHLGKCYHIFLNGNPVEIILGIGTSEHEVYQNQVYITSKYNLISFGLKEDIIIPHLKIRVNSGIFELTFGRHCLSNETVLADLSGEIREKIIPLYFESLMDYFSEDFILGSPEMVNKIEEMACSLVAFKPGIHSWSTFPLFKVHEHPRLSFNELSSEIERTGMVFIEAAGSEGTDFSMFNAPVLKINQVTGALDLIQKLFSSKVVNLNQSDIVLEAPGRTDLILTPEEKHFERFLVFKPKKEVLNRIINGNNQSSSSTSSLTRQQWSDLEEAVGICEEAKIVEHDFGSLIWKVNYLVERDGKTACNSRKFLFKEGTVILNLYHPEVREFIELSCVNPRLAAHWAMAMCLSDPKLISHITPEAREDLLLLDAMSRLDSDFNPITLNHRNSNSFIMDFLRNCGNPPFLETFF